MHAAADGLCPYRLVAAAGLERIPRHIGFALTRALVSIGPMTPMVPRSTLSSTSVPMQMEGGIYVGPVLINNAITLDFIVDSGATDVSIPADVVMTLMRTKTLKEADFLGEQTHVLADGSKVPSQTFVIKSLKVGNKVLENVNGSVASVRGSLLLGQTFLSRFKSWSVDNTKHVLLLSE
jgi:predicted aspartyl protease